MPRVNQSKKQDYSIIYVSFSFIAERRALFELFIQSTTCFYFTSVYGKRDKLLFKGNSLFVQVGLCCITKLEGSVAFRISLKAF